MGRVEDKVRALADEVARDLGYEVESVDLLGSGRRMLLRVTIDKEGGVDLEDCSAFSRDFGALLDAEDPIQGRYTLEVSSPGLDRPLKTPRDFARSVGKLAKIVTGRKIDGGNVFVGTISRADERTVGIVVGEREMEIALGDITRARLEIKL